MTSLSEVVEGFRLDALPEELPYERARNSGERALGDGDDPVSEAERELVRQVSRPVGIDEVLAMLRRARRRLLIAPASARHCAVRSMCAALVSGRGGSGRSHNQVPTSIMQPMGAATIQARRTGAVSPMVANTLAQTSIIHVAAHFACRGTARCSRHTRIMGPKVGWASKRASRRSEPRAAAHAAINTNTVVGSPGTKIPRIPRPRLA